MPQRWWAQISALMLIIVELCWVVPWYRTVIRISTVAPLFDTVLAFGLVMAAAYAFSLAMERMRLIRSVQMVGLVFVFAVSVTAALAYLLRNPVLRSIDGLLRLDPGAVLVLFAVLWLWWRGFSLSLEAIRPMIAWRRFELGLLLFMAHIFIVNRLGEQGPGVGWYIFFFVAGFSAVIFARVSYIGLAKGVAKNPFDRRWLLSTTGILGSAVLIAAVLSSLLTGQYRLLLVWSAEMLKFLVALFVFVVSIPGLALSYLAGPFLDWLRKFFHYQPAALEPLELESGAYPFANIAPSPVPISDQVQALLFWAVILLLIILLFLRMRRGLREHAADEKDSLESLLKHGEGRKLLRKALQDALDDISARFRPVRRRLAAARIRRIYAGLMDLCAEMGNPRPPNKTPNEFLPLMAEVMSAVQGDLHILTQAYVDIRYGVHPERRDELERVEQAWQRIEAEGQRIKKAGLHKLQTVEVKEVLKTGM